MPLLILALYLLGSIVSGIWLLMLGDWRAVVIGIVFILAFIFFTFRLPILPIVGGTFFTVSAINLVENGKKFLGILLGCFAIIYEASFVTGCCIGIMYFFLNTVNKGALIPMLIWSYEVALISCHIFISTSATWFSGINLLVAQVSYLTAMVMLYMGIAMSTVFITFGIIMLVGVMIQVTMLYLEAYNS